MPPTTGNRRIAAVALVLSLAACDAIGSTTQSGSAQGQQWREPPTYTATVEVDCGERDAAYGRWRITVEDRRLVEAEPLDQRAEQTAGIASVSSPPTIGDVLDAAATAEADGAEQVSIQRDAEGVPSRVDIDYVIDAMDDEACWTISDFAPGAGS